MRVCECVRVCVAILTGACLTVMKLLEETEMYRHAAVGVQGYRSSVPVMCTSRTNKPTLKDKHAPVSKEKENTSLLRIVMMRLLVIYSNSCI